jgi:NAD(P)H-hydrate epimerase
MNFPTINNKDLIPLTTAQLIKVDHLMVEKYGITVPRMMECAGLRLAELTKYFAPKPSHITIVAGKGHNGGDGFVAARHLANWGYQITILLCTEAHNYQNMPREQLNICQNLGLKIIDFDSNIIPQHIQQSAFILDCLLGFGLSGHPRDKIKTFINMLNTSSKPILALDCPSGLDTTTGTIYTPCIKAKATLTLAMTKTGFRNPQAKPYLGQLFLGDIGVPPMLYQQLNLAIKPLFQSYPILEIKDDES